MAVGFTRDGIQIDFSAYHIDSKESQPECWKLTAPGQIMRIATSWVPIIEEETPVEPPIHRAREVFDCTEDTNAAIPAPPSPPVVEPPIHRAREVFDCTEDTNAAIPAPPSPPVVEPLPPRPSTPRGYTPREIVECEPVISPNITPQSTKPSSTEEKNKTSKLTVVNIIEPIGVYLGECESLPESAGINDWVLLLSDRFEYKFTNVGWVQQMFIPAEDPVTEIKRKKAKK